VYTFSPGRRLFPQIGELREEIAVELLPVHVLAAVKALLHLPPQLCHGIALRLVLEELDHLLVTPRLKPYRELLLENEGLSYLVFGDIAFAAIEFIFGL
jgi:hypothetical protein